MIKKSVIFVSILAEGERKVRKVNTPIIETERLILRKFSDDDLYDMYEIYHDKEVNRYLPWFPFQSIEEAKEYLYNDIRNMTRK